MKTVIALVGVGLSAAVIFFLAAYGYSQSARADKAESKIAATEKLRKTTAAKWASERQRVIPFDQNETISEYGAPYNLRIVCQVRGSREAPGDKRAPLDMNTAPKVGDIYVKSCVAEPPTGSGPVG